MGYKDREYELAQKREYSRKRRLLGVTKNGDPIYSAERWHKLKRLKCGLTDDKYEQIIKQGCEICKHAYERTPHIDHDHRICGDGVVKGHVCEKCFRGILCDVCNTGFIRAIEQRPELRTFVSLNVLSYIDKLL